VAAVSGNVAPILWFENEKGEKWYPPVGFHDPDSAPEGFRYMWFRDPFAVHEELFDGKTKILTGNSTYPGDLALALCRPSWRERLKALFRYGSFGPTMPLDYAILRAALGCERCINADAHRVGLDWGYRAGSEPWEKANTRCKYCEEQG
jgi:hypothetical protein